MPAAGSFSRWDEEKKKCLSTCIRSSTLRTREAFSLSGVFRRKSEWVRERNREEEEEEEEEGKRTSQRAWFREPFHQSLCCETVPLLGLSDANCSEESVLLSAVYDCHSEKIWGSLKWAVLHNANLIFVLEKTSQLYIEVKPRRKAATYSHLDLIVLFIKVHCQTCHVMDSSQTWDIVI